jgi:hypothetical protein
MAWSRGNPSELFSDQTHRPHLTSREAGAPAIWLMYQASSCCNIRLVQDEDSRPKSLAAAVHQEGK